ncbi:MULTISPECIES: glycoside hydrolase family 16 protein [unclassified Curtobacterium]|jgi:beta-glucanase (GH16 family)|uniref:glycoside hydrolase family 16 protein n=1 Tax=unclassified Curtobacterium TaxID=257496 RepID=UPI00188D4972|nr:MULTISPECIES: glycoside hydrolase family 16 protein [unclassified Curtobacterium]MBF4591443.1 glycoside hydrolase family 16 protein [Curtobacterium sp. VKM Ac-1395]MCY1696118.1 glycoside hydrolase family 16 protein [Curtobacterium sp. SL109]
MQKRTTMRSVLAAAVLSAALVAVPVGSGATATAATSATFKQTFAESFRTNAAANGPFARTYANSWQPYPDGTGGMYWSGSQISAANGVMDVKLGGAKGAAGTFGTPTGAWGHKGGKFEVRAKATGGTANGAAFILWPTSNVWSEGEIDFPESNFEATPMLHQHSMVAGQESSATSVSTGVSWRTWHTYSVEWIPGKSVRYLVDGAVVSTVTKNVPRTAHRYMFQVGNWGAAGHLYIDYVRTFSYVG